VRRAALMMIGLALAGCARGGDGDQAGAPATSSSTVAGSPLDAAGAPTVAGDPSASTTGAPGVPGGDGTANATAGAPGAPGGSAAAIGSPGVGTGAGTGTGPGGEATGGAGGGGGDTGTGAGGSSGSPTTAADDPADGSGASGPAPGSVYATPEECAALRQLLGFVDHPELRQLAVAANCI
jgi:hypothetical protein